MESLVQSTRREILTRLKKRGAMTVNELSEALAITPMGVRQHLATLERDGLLEATHTRRGKGRPSQVYRLSLAGDELFPRTYGQLAVSLLDEISQLDGVEKVDAIFYRRTEKMRERYALRLRDKQGLELVQELAKIRDEEGYVAVCEGQDDGSFLLIEHNCPLRDVAGKYRQACRCEISLFKDLLGAEVDRRNCIADGDHQCRYSIRLAQAPGMGYPSGVTAQKGVV